MQPDDTLYVARRISPEEWSEEMTEANCYNISCEHHDPRGGCLKVYIEIGRNGTCLDMEEKK